MSWNNLLNEPVEHWGGTWTERKLNAFSKYVTAYMTILKKYPKWKTIYFDGFAGSGTKEKDRPTTLYTQLSINEEEASYKGAAERVLSLPENLQFDYYYFIDKNEQSLNRLKTTLSPKFKIEDKHQFRPGDANKALLDLAKALHTGKYAALVFLDPFGMQIDWSSIEQMKGTRSDVWILVPTGIIVNRLLDRAAELKYIDKLQSFFGMTEEEIRLAFYQQHTTATLFGEEEKVSKIAKPIEKIAKLYATRMETIWKYVTKEPLRLNNRNGVPIFHFVFASNNQAAYNIASQIIKNI